MHDSLENGSKVMSPPVVVYSLLSAGRPVEMSPLEQLTFLASVIMSRFHFTNANLICDEAWSNYLHEIGFSPFFDEKVVIDVSKDATLPVFWSTRAKLEALKWAYTTNEGSRSILQLDADVIIWDASMIRWEDESQKFVGGYYEPLHWEAYREQTVRLGALFSEVAAEVGLSAPTGRERPVNGGCLWFNDIELLESYMEFLEKFMSKFAEGGYVGRPFLTNKNDRQSGTVMFSEVMMADQRSLGLILSSFYSAREGFADGVQFFTVFPDEDEYPLASHQFIHLWKYKGVLNANPQLAAQMEQYILRKLKNQIGSHSLLDDLGCYIIERPLAMTPETHLTLVRV